MYGINMHDSNRNITKERTSGNWFQEQVNAINDKKTEDMYRSMSPLDRRFEDTRATIMENFNQVDITRDAEIMFKNKDIMNEYKRLYLEPFLESFEQDVIEATTGISDRETQNHLQYIREQLEEAWDNKVDAYRSQLFMESYNTAGYLPIATLDFPALLKQYIRFLGKDLIPIENTSKFNIEMRIFTQKLRDNNTGEEWEIPKVYFQKEEDGSSTWDKLWNVGKGIRLNSKAPITAAMIDAAVTKVPGSSGMMDLNRRFNLFKWLQDDQGLFMDISTLNPAVPGTPVTPDASYGAYVPPVGKDVWADVAEINKQNIRTRLSYDIAIQYVQIDTTALGGAAVKFKGGDGASKAEIVDAAGAHVDLSAEQYLTVRLNKGGIVFDLQTNGTFINGALTPDQDLAVVVYKDGKWVPTGVSVNISEMVSGQVDFVHGTIVWSSLGLVSGVYVDGRISNETNLRTIGFREYPELRKFTISDGCRFQLPFTVEDFANAGASLNFNLYNRMTQALVVNQELFEDQYILEFLDEQFLKYSGQDSNIWDLETYTHTEYAELNPSVYIGGGGVAVDPIEFRTNSIQNAIASTIYELSDKGKMDNLGFVVYCNPKVARLLRKYVTWTIKNTTDLGGISMNHSFGMMTDENISIRVVASTRVPAFTEVPSTAAERLQYAVDVLGTGNPADADPYTMSREYHFKIVAYPQDKFHVSFKHYRFARHMTNTPENAAYMDHNSPGGSAMVINTSSRYRTIAIQGVLGRVVCRSSRLVPDANAGLFIPQV